MSDICNLNRLLTYLKNALIVCTVVTALLLISQPASGQAFQGQITGQVVDQNGAIITDAVVHATNVEKGTTSTTKTDASGEYKFPSLLPATYVVTIEKSGFNSFEAHDIILAVNQTLRLDATLTVGTSTESISINSSGNQMDVTSGSLGQVVTTIQIEELPLDVRDPLGLVILTPGTVTGPDFGNGGGPNVGRNFFKSNFNVGGGKSGSQALLIDGAPNTTGDVSRAIINPPVDAVQEFKVQATSYDAQFGRTSGAVVNMLTKSGTNAIHGTAYDFERDSHMQAANYFPSGDIPDWHRRQVGGVVGFPIMRDRWFGFADFEALRQATPTSSRSTVPTELERQGNFIGKMYTTTSSTGTTSRPVVIYDPATYNPATGLRKQIVGCDGVTKNVICDTRISALAKSLIAMYPLPNNPGDANHANNYNYNENQITNSNKYDFRTDVNIGPKTALFGRFSRQADDRLSPGALPPARAGNITTDRYTQIVIGLNRVITQNFLAGITLSFSRANAVQTGGLPQVDLAALGFSSNFASQSAPQLPQLSTSDMTSLIMKSNVGQQHQPRNTYAAVGLVTWLHGKHSFKFGGEYWQLNFNEYQNSVSSGLLKFDHAYTQANPASGTSKLQGSDVASLLLGIPSGINPASQSSGSYIRKVQAISTQGLYYAGFIQDDYRVSSRLTLNLGMRWDVNIGDREKYNRLAWFDPDAPSPLGPSIGNPNLKGQVVWTGYGNDRNQQKTFWWNFNPRFGFAHQITSNLVLRGGYGVFFLPRSVQGSGVGAVGTTVDTVLPINPPVPVSTLDNPFPSGVNMPNNNRSPIAAVGSTISIPTHDFKPGYVQMFSFGFQGKIPMGIVTDVHYWGNLGVHIPMSIDMNLIPSQYIYACNQTQTCDTLGKTMVSNPFYGVIPGQQSTYSLLQSLLPFPQYLGESGLSRPLAPLGHTNYNALTAQAQKMFSRSFSFTAQYTWGKAMDDLTTPLNNQNRDAEYALSDLDVTNQFIASFITRLPYGRGRRWGAHAGKLANGFLGGWNLNGIVRMQSGFPVGVSRPSTLDPGSNPHVDHPTPNHWFNTDGIRVASYSYGNIGPQLSGVRSDPIRNLDTVVEKTFNYEIRQHNVSTLIRVEAYNVFNHPQFASPVGTITSTNFGTVTAQANQPRFFQFGAKVKF